MRSMCRNAFLFMLLGTAVGVYHTIKVNVSAMSSNSQNICTLNISTVVFDLKYRVRKPKPPTNITVEIIDDGKIVGAFYNDSTEMKFGKKYSFPLNNTFVKNGTLFHVIVNGSNSSVTVSFRTSEKGGSCYPMPTRPTTSLYRSTTPTRQQEGEDGKTHVILPLLVPFTMISALIISFKYRKRLMMFCRQITGDHNIKEVRTISSERSSTPTQLTYVNTEHNVSNMHPDNMDDDSKNDYAELRTDDITYTVPEVRLSCASLSSFLSLKDQSEEDGEYHLPMHSSMSALNQHYAQPGATISTARSMDSLSIPPINSDDYMSMGSRFASFSHHYDRPTSSQSSDNSKTATSRTCPQFYRDQEDYVSMFSQEENYSNIGKALGESFRDKKHIRKYNKHNIKRKEHSKSESDNPDG